MNVEKLLSAIKGVDMLIDLIPRGVLVVEAEELSTDTSTTQTTTQIYLVSTEVRLPRKIAGKVEQ